jgi:hypothetical protein
MSDNLYLDRILADVEKVHGSWDELFAAPFTIAKVCALVNSLVQAAEAIITDPGTGAQKQALVMDAWTYLDDKYNVIGKLDDLVRLPFFLEPFDGPVLRVVVETVLIPLSVSVFNLTIWRKP